MSGSDKDNEEVREIGQRFFDQIRNDDDPTKVLTALAGMIGTILSVSKLSDTQKRLFMAEMGRTIWKMQAEADS